MNRFGNDDPCYRPESEELAAYAAGELHTQIRPDVEAWLAGERDAAAAVESQHELLALWRESNPRMPTEAEWARVLDQIEVRVQKAKRLRVRQWLSWSRYVAAGSVAAVVAVALLGGMPVLSPAKPDPQLPLTVIQQAEELPERSEMFVVACPADVEIVSMHAADVGTLLVGEAPVREPLVLLSPKEVTLERVEPDENNLVPEIHGGATTAPMIVAPDVPAVDRMP